MIEESIVQASTHMKVSEQSASELDDEDSGFWHQLALTAGAIVAFSFVSFLIYRVHYRHEMSREVNSFAHTFINCSPVIADQLGTVKRVKESEDHFVSCIYRELCVGREK
jgi:hypothetical protein